MHQEPKKDGEKWYEKLLKREDIPWMELAILLLILSVFILQHLRGDGAWVL